MGFIRVAKNGWNFEDADTGEIFVPIGSNYCSVVARYKQGAFMSQVFHLFGTDEDTEQDGVAEARKAMKRLGDLGLNVLRVWLEPDEFFTTGLRLDPAGAGKLDALMDACRQNGIRLSLGMHLAPCASGWKLHNFQPPHYERQLELLYLLANRWGKEEQVFSWTIIGEGQLPWYTERMARKWPAFLQYWYNDNLDELKKAWGGLSGVNFSRFADAPVPPRNIGACLGCDRVNPGRLKDLPHDPWALSTWRYDWRMFLEEIGSRRVHEEVRALRAAGARQMVTVGANCWTFPNLPAAQMTMGYNPYFYLDSVDYLCEHNYPAPQCLPGGNGDPLGSEEAMKSWLSANEVMARIYSSMGKPVVMEEFGWYGGGTSNFLCPLPYRSEEDQQRYNDRLMETTQHCFSGWFYWLWRDMPKAADITNLSGIYASDGKRLKPWGRSYARWAERLKKDPPRLAPAKKVVDLPIKALFTSDVEHETWWQRMISENLREGPFDFRPVFERKPMTDTLKDLRGVEVGK